MLTVHVVLTRCQGPRQPQPPPGRSSRSAGDSQMINGVGESSAEEGAKRSSSRHRERKGQPQGGGGASAEAGRTGAMTNAGGWEGGHLKLPRHRAPLTRCHFSAPTPCSHLLQGFCSGFSTLFPWVPPIPRACSQILCPEPHLCKSTCSSLSHHFQGELVPPSLTPSKRETYLTFLHSQLISN